MPDYAARDSRFGDEEALKSIWSLAFGDSAEFIDMFFSRFYRPGTAILIEKDGVPVSAGYTFFGYEAHVPGSPPLPLCLGYAIGTLPEHFGKGFGAGVTRAMRDKAANAPGRAFCVSPSEYGLRRWYSNVIGARDCFMGGSLSVRRRDLPDPGFLKASEIDAEEYNPLRSRLLAGTAHVRFPSEAAAYLQAVCRFCGGGLFRIDCGRDIGCAAVEPSENGLRLTELIVSEKYFLPAVALAADMFRAETVSVRTPVAKNAPRIPTVMASAPAGSAPAFGEAYWGPVFD